MATASLLHVSRDIVPEYAVANVHKDALDFANDALQRNHDETHVFFNSMLFHNHLSHFMLNYYALGADTALIKKQFETDWAMQKPLRAADPATVAGFDDPQKFMAGLAVPDNYADYLAFFHKELAARPWQEVVYEYLFKGDERANIMHNRLYSSIIHPFIHLGLAMEFDQPALMVESLAMTAVHEDWLDPFFDESESIAASPSAPAPARLLSVYDALHADRAIAAAVAGTGREAKPAAVKHALPALARHCAAWRVAPSDDLARAAAHIVHDACLVMGASQADGKAPKMDFGLMHSVTSTVALASFLKQDWLSAADKARILTYKGRCDLAEYVGRGSPALVRERIATYPPAKSAEAVAMRAPFHRDGHVAKMIRAILLAQRTCAPYEQSEAFFLKGDMWLRLANLAMDSTTDGQLTWIFGGGFEEAWRPFKNLDQI